ncbi:Anaerobic cobalt chelatase [Desulfonema limicola]|uniref:Anaerobic cobalt chelatase n=1 Tax=Desulfonema limicola TaxID=45656 RepID=A0A975BCW0_9BACT|nr:sirohydrochlorin cobaltochelatase [Desulfonema limicola]QTA83042.1 Anaerobic cobalt chelatase [Desulfonema limicola]
MLNRFLYFILIVMFTFCGTESAISSNEHGKTGNREYKTAIVLASFGTTVPSAVESITNIQDKVKKEFPGIPVKITFTSNIIRSVWKERQAEPEKWLNQGISREILYVENIISTIGDLMEQGYKNIIVQPTHIFFMEQSHDLNQYIQALASIRTIKKKWKPFNRLVMGRPALGMPGDIYSYHDDLEKALKTLLPDVELAKKEKAVLVYMAHGNEHWSTGIYAEAQALMQTLYPDVKTFIGCVEGYPGIDHVVNLLSHIKADKVVIKPFMIVAGDHAVNDMAGQEEDSWQNIMTKKGFNVMPVLKGLGSNDAFADIFVEHIKDAAINAGISLK